MRNTTAPPLPSGTGMVEPRLEQISPLSLVPYGRNARTHSKKQVAQIAASIAQFGFNNPVLVSDDNQIIAGHGRVSAARLLGLESVPILRLSHLNQAQRRAYVLADNKLALNAGWDQEILAIELQGLLDLEMDITLTGFSLAETDFILDAASQADPASIKGHEDHIPDLAACRVTKPGDIWIMGRHRLICGDARSPEPYQGLMQGQKADLVFTDPPYNLPIEGHVSGLGRHQHQGFCMGVGEMSPEAFTQFLQASLGTMAEVCKDGAIAFVCMDWRHIGELISAGRNVFSELKNLCVWNKTNAGMGSFYRSKHELVLVYKVGTADHTNTFGLGRSGRYRTNVWDYAGVTSFSGGRQDALSMHPTVKPTAMVADAIKDCSKRGDIVLDGFGGSGTTLIAAQACGRSARIMELDPHYCDTIVRRYQAYTGKAAVLEATGQTFDTLEDQDLEDIPNVQV